MIKDYSESYSAGKKKHKTKTRKRKKASGAPHFLSLSKLMWKTIGVMLFATLVVGVSSTFWYGWQIQLALDEIGSTKAANRKLAGLNLQLTNHRDMLLSHVHMEKAAKKLGLYPPTKSQLRYPH